MKVTGVIAAQIKSIENTRDVCIVRLETKPGTGQPFHYLHFTLRAYSSLAKIAGDIEGPYDVELLQYSEKDQTLVTDVIVINPSTEKD
jgi:hypothetical protein